jgi:hypothetical protein
MTYKWEFVMDEKEGPTYNLRTAGGGKLVAYARRAKEHGWFVRIAGLNDTPNSEKIYIEDDIFPPEFMATMAALHGKNF